MVLIKKDEALEYATQLAEKQKAKYTYGILEKQFSNLFKKLLLSLELPEKYFSNYVSRD